MEMIIDDFTSCFLLFGGHVLPMSSFFGSPLVLGCPLLDVSRTSFTELVGFLSVLSEQRGTLSRIQAKSILQRLYTPSCRGGLGSARALLNWGTGEH
jgi:hypothetical protein